MSAKDTEIDGLSIAQRKRAHRREGPEIKETCGETHWDALLSRWELKDIKTVSMKQETKEVRAKTLWTVVKDEEEREMDVDWTGLPVLR